jgi:cardiolipin synthase
MRLKLPSLKMLVLVDRLLPLISELAIELPPDRMKWIATSIDQLKSVDDFRKAVIAFGTKVSSGQIEAFEAGWRESSATPSEVAAALRGAAHTANLTARTFSIDLVWTGPDTGLIPIRRTEQVLLELIDSAERDIFLVSYVFYQAKSIVDALNAASARGVKVSILVEDDVADSASTAVAAVPSATVYIWPTNEGVVHAKCAVCDGKQAFISSANVTGAAMEKNMELGAVLNGGDTPMHLRSHLHALVGTGVVDEWHP